MSVAIKKVESYSGPALREAVSEILSMDSGLAGWLGEGDPGRLVVVKPNWLRESHQFRQSVWEPVITHPAVVLAVVEELARLMSGRGTLCICDAPVTSACFEKIVAHGGLLECLRRLECSYPDLSVEVIDLRREIWRLEEEVVVERTSNKPDPRGYVSVDLGRDSLFYKYKGEGRYYGADYDSDVVNRHHHGQTHEYLLAGTAMRCDLFVNVPKLKTHKKAGITCCLKNLVGINGDKNWLPHYTKGTAESGGDEFSGDRRFWRAESMIKRIAMRCALAFPGAGGFFYRKARKLGVRTFGESEEVIRNGNWHGNDTCWRMALDLNRAFLYGNQDGTLRDSPNARRYVAVVDGITGGEGNGPQAPDAVSSGVLIGGCDPAVIDAVACRLMGFDPMAFPIVRGAFSAHRWPIAGTALKDVVIQDDRAGEMVSVSEVAPVVKGGFKPPFAWEGGVRKAGEQNT